MYVHMLFIHPSVAGPLGCFPFLTIEDAAALKLGVQIYVQLPALKNNPEPGAGGSRL
jgi:hypothetical protein